MAITTKTPRTLAAISLAFLTLASGALAQAVTVDKPKIEITIQATPRFTIDGKTDPKRDTQKFWIEVEVGFKADQRGGDPNKEFIDELEFKYFITVSPKNKKDRKVYTATITHANIEKGAELYSVAYMSPTTVAKIMGKGKNASKTDVDVAVEIRHQGQLVAGDATKSASTKWWNSMAQSDGQVLKKSETPFAPLWFDRYPETK